MTITASLSLGASNANVNDTVNATLTISNSGGSNVTLSSLRPKSYLTGGSINEQVPWAVSAIQLSPVQTVPAGSSLVIKFSASFFSPSTDSFGYGSGTFSIGADIVTSDGSFVNPTAQTISITPMPLPSVPSLAQSVLTLSSSSITSGSSVTATLTTINSNKVPVYQKGLTITLAASGGSSTVTIGAVTDNGNGTYTASITGVLAGTATTITGSIQGSALTSTAPTATVSAGAATQLSITTQPVGAVHGSPLATQPVVKLLDAAGNVTTSTANVVAAIGTNPGSGTLSGTTTIAAVAGVATFTNLAINNAGTGYTLTFTSTGLTSATSNAFNMT